jgi:hypothetical protein
MMNLISLKDASKNLPYSAEYLGLLVRKNRLFGKKVDGKWMTTKEAVDEYIQKVAEANYAHQQNLNVRIPAAEQKTALTNLKWALVLAGIIIIILTAWGLDSKNKNNNDEYIIQKDDKNNLTIQVDDPSSIGSVTIVPKK